jgi:hypothetical protein
LGLLLSGTAQLLFFEYFVPSDTLLEYGMQEGYQIIKLKNRVSDVLTQMSIKVSDVLTLLGQRCADNYQLLTYFILLLKMY